MVVRASFCLTGLITIRLNLKTWFYPKIVDLRIRFWKQNIFILWLGQSWGWGTDPDDKGEIFIFRFPFYAIIDQHEISYKNLRNFIMPKIFWFNTNYCVWWVHSGDYLWQTSSEILFLSVINDQIINQHLILDQKRPSLIVFTKKYMKKLYLTPTARP